MDGFTVQPAALDGYAKTLSDIESTTGGLDRKYLIDANNYVASSVKLPGGSGGMIFSAIVGKIDDVCRQLTADNALISTTLTGSADGLHASAHQYRAHDHASAVRLDSTYKPARIIPLEGNVDIASPNRDPSSKLTPPGTDGAVPDWVQNVLDGAGYLSVTGMALKILGWFGLHVEDWVKERFVGDFHAVATSRNAILNLAQFDYVAATAVAEGATTMLKSWQGKAANAAKSHFDQLANALDGRYDALQGVALQHDAVVVAIQQAGSEIISALSAALDSATVAAVKIAAAGCLQNVPGVNAVVDAMAGWQVVDLVKKIHKVVSTWDRIWSINEELMAAITGLAGILPGFDVAAKLPVGSYYNASQGGPPDVDYAGDAPHGHATHGKVNA